MYPTRDETIYYHHFIFAGRKKRATESNQYSQSNDDNRERRTNENALLEIKPSSWQILKIKYCIERFTTFSAPYHPIPYTQYKLHQ